MKLESLINTLIERVEEQHIINVRDKIYFKNRIASLCHIEPTDHLLTDNNYDSIPEILNAITVILADQGVIENLLDTKEIKSAEIMDVFIDAPSIIEQKFYTRAEQNPEEATQYFYHLSKVSNYIQTERIAKNVHYLSDTKYGELDITINLSKPEKDPEEIKRLKSLSLTTQETSYPKCMLCIENEGYQGRLNYPARANHRMINIKLNDEDWFFQYSPYSYYNEHAIVLSKHHTPMQINRETFVRLIEFVEKFPHYFIGSNADLPIVGGSMLTHDHYQAGNYTFAMAKAQHLYEFNIPRFSHTQFSILNWPMSVIRLSGQDKSELISAASHILTEWRNYSDQENEIISHTGEEPHNTITPIARVNNDSFELDLVLRNNRTNDEHPSGIFHPHDEHHHIKRENIGLIEVMGLAVLPPRLKDDIEEIKNYLAGNVESFNEIHNDWVQTLKKGLPADKALINNYVDTALGNKFALILEDAGVFKSIEPFKKFIAQIEKSSDE